MPLDQELLSLSKQRPGTPRTILLEIKDAILRQFSSSEPVYEDVIFTGIEPGFGKRVFEALAEDPEVEGIAAR